MWVTGPDAKNKAWFLPAKSLAIGHLLRWIMNSSCQHDYWWAGSTGAFCVWRWMDAGPYLPNYMSPSSIWVICRSGYWMFVPRHVSSFTVFSLKQLHFPWNSCIKFYPWVFSNLITLAIFLSLFLWSYNVSLSLPSISFCYLLNLLFLRLFSEFSYLCAHSTHTTLLLVERKTP